MKNLPKKDARQPRRANTPPKDNLLNNSYYGLRDLLELDEREEDLLDPDERLLDREDEARLGALLLLGCELLAREGEEDLLG